MPVLSGAEPFSHDGSDDIGVLLCHGFTSTPQSMRAWGEHLAAEGCTVRCPLLPGHGTRWPDLNRTTWHDWYRAAEAELAELRGRCSSVFVFGQSMGGTLTLRLAQEHPDIAGIVLVNPSVLTQRRAARLLPLLSRVWPAAGGIPGDIAKPGGFELAYQRLPLRAMASLQQLWGVVRADLGRIRQPVLLFRSAVDHVVEPVNAATVLDGVRSEDLTEVVLADSFHVATLDHDAPRLFSGSVEFLQRIHRDRVEELV
ncbi:carboxylesterase [Saccharopolyspora antimicrobica]|uniref:Carboxylesterase n=1 Tax=Saccharopolyspora antimicrobica TaxID=455193 RepID=A0A1I5JC10_9PSEU|nr:alpha/beta fold hydrolase [Saccharopolyspora antimicrobica]RKT82462.1 carboxylesterase [Saccharopolyspora antimicrobica]SFO70345.1 carboxylesterase [Saccharopolyspora antimicrobica]